MAAYRPGDVFAGKYVLERVLGAGGMGMVMGARHATLGSPVAIKVLLPAASSIPGANERFVREARAAAALRGEHVARVLDVGVAADGAPYLVMEHLHGSDLRAVLRARGPLPIAEAAEYLVQVCDAMTEAHAYGIVHRDLKPSNLFLTQRSNGMPLVKVLDFGLAKILEDAPRAATDASLTATGLVVGSPPYMPPEQLRSLKLADTRSDIWSMGVVLFELLAGRVPFSADRPEGLIVAIATDSPPPLRSLRPDVPEGLETIVLRCLQKDPQQRIQSAAELGSLLRPFAELLVPMSARFGSFPSLPSHPPPSALMMGEDSAKTVAHDDATTLTLGSSELMTARSARATRSLLWVIGGAALLGLASGAVLFALRPGASDPALAPEPTTTTERTPAASDVTASAPPAVVSSQASDAPASSASPQASATPPGATAGAATAAPSAEPTAAPEAPPAKTSSKPKPVFGKPNPLNRWK